MKKTISNNQWDKELGYSPIHYDCACWSCSKEKEEEIKKGESWRRGYQRAVAEERCMPTRCSGTKNVGKKECGNLTIPLALSLP